MSFEERLTDVPPDYENYDYTREWAQKQIEDLAEKKLLESWIREKPGESCLELGGGFGRLTELFQRHFAKVVMVDFSNLNIRRASRRARDASILRSELHSLPFKDSSFDYVFMIRVVHHLSDPLSVIDEIQRVSRDGATVIISAPNPIFGKHRRIRSNTLVGEASTATRSTRHRSLTIEEVNSRKNQDAGPEFLKILSGSS